MKSQPGRARQRPFAWIAFGGGLATAFCLLSTLLLLAAEAWLSRASEPLYVVNACFVISSQGPAQIGMGWRMPRLSSVARLAPYRSIRTHSNSVCGAIPWTSFLPREGAIILPLGGPPPSGQRAAAGPQG